jgi:hypothetical protein
MAEIAEVHVTDGVPDTGTGEAPTLAPVRDAVLAGNALLTTIDADTAALVLALADPATQTTLAAVLAKIIAAPATEAKQDTLIAKDFATQTTLAAILAKIIAAPSTEAKQDAANALLTTIDGDTGVLGAVADAAAVDGTVKAALRAIATALGVTALDLGVGTGGSRSLRVAIDTAQIGSAGPQVPASSVSVAGAKYKYTTVTASGNVALGAAGAAGDYLHGVLIIPGTTSPGAVQIGDSTTDTTIFAGGASSVATLHPFFVPIGAQSAAGGWSVITGTNVTAIAIGHFTEA